MNTTIKLSYAIAAILSGATVGAADAATESATTGADDSDQIQAITVTAQRRAENMQNVPIAIQALSAETLKELNVTTFDDYIRYLPNVSSSSNGPGQGNIYMRGLSVGATGSQAAGSLGLYPNVAIYLDDQSGQLPARNLDIYAADLERIEILEGPQGTLFGAGAEAGVVRYITNKPKLDVTEGNVNAGYGVTAHGDPNSNLSAVLNVPLIANTLAVRALIYSDSRGGYIDNVPATFTRKNTDLGVHYANYPAVNGRCPNGLPNSGYCVPPGSPVLNNYNIAQRAINPVTYKGTRVEALYQINDDWNVLVTQMYQNLDSEGVFYQQPNASDGAPLQPLEVTLFNPTYAKDHFENTAWTVNGKLGNLHAVYTGSYLDRKVEQVGDYTNYARAVYADYYQCYGPGTGSSVNGGKGDLNLKSTCVSPSSTWRETVRNQHLSQEIRVSTPDNWRLRGIAGAFYEDQTLFDDTAWQYKTVPSCTSNGAPGTPGNTACFSDVGTAPGATVSNPGVQNDAASFIEDTRRETKQTAFFASLDYDIIPEVLTITAGTRHFLFQNSLKGDITGSFGCFEQGTPAGGCLNSANNIDARGLADTESGWRSRGNLTWHITPDAMVYFTYSQGFRPGGFNRTGGSQYLNGPDGVPQFILPNEYKSDSLTNQEIGWKTEWFNHRIQWNGAVYRENWNNVQISFTDIKETGNLEYNTNGQDFRIKGVETSLIARVIGGLTLQWSAAWNQSVQTNSPALIDTNPQSVNFGKPITEKCDSSGANCVPISNLFGPIGTPSANSPPSQFSARARYEFPLGDYHSFAQFGATHTGHSFTQTGSLPALATGGQVVTILQQFENPAYTVYDASFGVAKDAWNVQFYVQNLTNSHTSINTNTDQFELAQTVLRPRVMAVTFGYKF